MVPTVGRGEMTDDGAGIAHPIQLSKSAYAVRPVTVELTSLPYRELCPLALSHTFVLKNGLNRTIPIILVEVACWIKFPVVC